jgi:hypothetical protein
MQACGGRFGQWFRHRPNNHAEDWGIEMKMTSARFALRLCVASAALSLVAGAAMAQAEKTPARAKDANTITPQAVVAAVAPNAQLVALVRGGGQIIMQKNVDSVSNPATGIYCIRPAAAAAINVDRSIVTLTPEFFYSNLNEIKVQWAKKGSPCPAGRFAVYTMADANLDGRYTFSNAVGFSMLVP